MKVLHSLQNVMMTVTDDRAGGEMKFREKRERKTLQQVLGDYTSGSRKFEGSPVSDTHNVFLVFLVVEDGGDFVSI